MRGPEAGRRGRLPFGPAYRNLILKFTFSNALEPRSADTSVPRHRRLRACGSFISSEKPPVMPASIGDRYASRSGLPARSGSALASALALLRVRGWARKCKTAAIAEVGPGLVVACVPAASGCNPTTVSFFSVSCTSTVLLVCGLNTARRSLTHLVNQRIAQLQYLLPDFHPV